jgi:Ribbon-helix-helix protein, copG family
MAKIARSAVLTLRVTPDLDRRIERVARRRRRTKSAVLREALQDVFGGESPSDDPAREARRQSLLVSSRGSERETLEFLEHSADDKGWR